MWGWERIYGPAPSSYSSINEMNESGRIMINKFVGADGNNDREAFHAETMRDEITKIIIGESSIDDFDTFCGRFQ